MTSQELQSQVDALMEENKVGENFSACIPSDWPTEAWRMVLNSESPHWDQECLHVFVARHVHAPAEIVRELATSPYWRVRVTIAMKRNLPKDLFPILAQSPDEAVRSTIAANKKAPITVIESLKNDEAESVREMVGRRLANLK
jgi:hypothetical protein